MQPNQVLTVIHDGVQPKSSKIVGYSIFIRNSLPYVEFVSFHNNQFRCWERCPEKLVGIGKVNFSKWWSSAANCKSPEHVAAFRIENPKQIPNLKFQEEYAKMKHAFDSTWDLILCGGRDSPSTSGSFGMSYQYQGDVSAHAQFTGKIPLKWMSLTNDNTHALPSRWLVWADTLKGRVECPTGFVHWKHYPGQCLANVRFLTEVLFQEDLPSNVRTWLGKIKITIEDQTSVEVPHVWMTIEEKSQLSVIDTTVVHPDSWLRQAQVIPDDNALVTQIMKLPISQRAVVGRVPATFRYSGFSCSPKYLRSIYSNLPNMIAKIKD